MSATYSTIETQLFTIIHARHIAAKVATDLKRVQRLYGEPSDQDIADYEKEAIELLKAGMLGKISYGYHRNGLWIEPTLTYTAKDLIGISDGDDDPGRILPGANVEGARFYSYLTYAPEWYYLSEDEKNAIQDRLPFERTGANEPGINGYLNYDLTYSAGGRALYRAAVRSF